MNVDSVCKKKINCDECEMSFESVKRQLTRKNRFCSRACFIAHRESGKSDYFVRVKKEKACQQCYAVFVADNAGRKFCSQACFLVHRKSYQYERSRVKKICLQCKKDFVQKKTNRGFCSRSCAGKHHFALGNIQGWINSGLRKKTGGYQPCVECGASIYVLPSRMGDGKNRVCSKECRNERMRAWMIANNPTRGRRASTEQKARQRAVMLERHGVDNAFKLAKRRTKTRPQVQLFEALSARLPDEVVEIEKMVCKAAGKERYADILIPGIGVVVELYGDYWHCNPKKFSSQFFHHVKKLTVTQIWEDDRIRETQLRDAGYNVIVVWEDEWKRDRNGVLERVITFVNESRDVRNVA